MKNKMNNWVLKVTEESLPFINKVRQLQSNFREAIVVKNVHHYNYYNSVSLNDGRYVTGTMFKDEIKDGKVEIDLETFKEYYNLMETKKQTLTRKQLIELKSMSNCGKWNNSINYILNCNIFNISNDFEIPQVTIDLLVKEGTYEQKEAVKDLGITFSKSKADDYLEKHRACGLKIGDKVIIKNTANSHENGWIGSWVSDMTNCVGQTLSILDDNGMYGFECKIKDGNSRYYYPYFVLEKVVEKYVPFNFEDDLLGKHVISKDKSCKGIITFQNQVRVEYGVHIKTYESLLEHYTFLNDTPCGKLKQQ